MRLPKPGLLFMKLTLFRKFLLALFLIALLPLAISSVTLFMNLQSTSRELAARLSAATDQQASENLESRARQIADDVSDFLEECENDLRLVAALPHTPATLRTFYDNKREEIWQRSGSAAQPTELRKTIPRYATVELIDKNGQQLFVLDNGRTLPAAELANVAVPANTRFQSETYFRETARLNRGEVYVSHLSGFHIGKKEQLGTAPDSESAFGGREYAGVIRFATPLFDAGGSFSGIIVLALDHRHLMEFTQHVQPGKVAKTVFPSYKSGNYSFLFDDEGWIITHPNFWDLRGVDAAGRQVPPYSTTSTAADIQSGRIPFNLDFAGFIHPNYPVAAQQVRLGKSGYVDTTNVGGARKVMAYAPIFYKSGVYRRHGVFGGVTIGFQTDLFHEPARAAAAIINEQMRDHLRKSAIILAITTILAFLAAWRISSGITRPLALLTAQTRSLADGSGSSRVEINSGDEVGGLAQDFNRMAAELESRNRHLLETLAELDRSRQQVTGERNFMEGVVNSISSAILPFSPDGLLISVNTNGRAILGEQATVGSHYRAVFAHWPELTARIEQAVAGNRPFGRDPFTTGSSDGARYFDVGIFPIGTEMEQGITVTIRDETEKERMREEMTRLDRLASLGRLSAGIAHEIRNPLTGITLLLDDLHDRPAFDDQSRELMKCGLEEIERMEKLINALLSYAAPPRAEFRESALKPVIEETLLFFRKSCEKGGVALVSSLAEIPPLVLDADKIRQMLLNLLRNSLSATESGGMISVATAVKDGMAELVVSDSGQGIPAEDIDHVFEPFFTRSGGGTGLGLSISQRIVEEHHGTIAVASTAGKGTVFTIRLPLKTVAEDNHGKDTDNR
jgi:signal transduction histidine kinase